MAGTAVLRRLTWQPATIAEVVPETDQTRTLLLDVPGWPGHRAGQHVDVRLTADDGYQATRAYSLAGAPGERPALTVARVEGGEVSPYLVDVAGPGDQVEVRGPIGGYFVWEPTPERRPLLLVAGGSGVVPLRSMLRHRARLGDGTPVRLLYSARDPGQVVYRDELEAADGEVTFVYTRSAPTDWPEPVGRIDRSQLARLAWPPAHEPLAYVCGPTAFVEHVAQILTALGYPPTDIRTERYG
ncbi:ferredoxin reductase [Nonomuraea spiralis]|uniref:Ferredoxin reductase n=1 Tax=Nonomuraea spiralis TaxID=46182 RepID=A0ABV5IPP2_9ACTN|nr:MULTISPECIES: ferredoxin reductase [Nonomuraea]RSN08623.1 oxidoreductase [Nonomuraea sp. WAC 01424]GGT28687.1 oxidoreductase [Nonomuraea spiralis]